MTVQAAIVVTITVTVDSTGDTYTWTREEAVAIRDALNNALGPVTPWTLPPGQGIKVVHDSPNAPRTLNPGPLPRNPPFRASGGSPAPGTEPEFYCGPD